MYFRKCRDLWRICLLDKGVALERIRGYPEIFGEVSSEVLPHSEVFETSFRRGSHGSVSFQLLGLGLGLILGSVGLIGCGVLSISTK